MVLPNNLNCYCKVPFHVRESILWLKKVSHRLAARDLGVFLILLHTGIDTILALWSSMLGQKEEQARPLLSRAKARSGRAESSSAHPPIRSARRLPALSPQTRRAVGKETIEEIK
jgi:hypothetical protein